MSKPDKYELLAETARRRGFFWQSYEIYGGVSGFFNFGPLGVRLKRKIEDRWRNLFVKQQEFVEIESPIVAPASVFKASGHEEHFLDPMINCVNCQRKFRPDHLLEEQAGLTSLEGLSLAEMRRLIEEKNAKCPECGGSLGQPQHFNLMFKTMIGPYTEALAYCRPEAAQGMFTDFKRLYEYVRERIPFAAAQIGHVLRNEISPRQGPVRLREFTIMELELFFDPEKPSCPRLKEVEEDKMRILTEDMQLRGVSEPEEVTVKEALEKAYIVTQWQAYFMALSKRFMSDLGVPQEKQMFKAKLPTERAHYAKQVYDHVVFLERWGWVEIAGHAYRTDYDLSGHTKHSKVDMRVFEPYEKPVKREIKSLIPNMPAIQRTFGKETSRIAKALSESNPEEVERALESSRHFDIGGHKILPEHVEVKTKDVEETGRRYIPHVVEPSFGADRIVYATLEYAYSTAEDRVVLKMPKEVAPIQTVVLPLVAKDGLPEKARELYKILRNEGFDVEYDEGGSIGRRYARADEIGVPVAITVDYQSKEDDTATLRNRDTWKQVRVELGKIPALLREYLTGKANFENLGKPV